MKHSVASLGPHGSFTSRVAEATAELLAAELQFCDSVEESLRLVHSGAATWALVPVETNLRGVVDSHVRVLEESALRTRLEVVDRAIFVLAATHADLDRIDVLASHQHALEECSAWIAKHLGEVSLRATRSTSDAARIASSDGSVAAICSELAARDQGLDVVATDVANPPGDLTRYLLVGGELPASASRFPSSWKTTIKLRPSKKQRVPIGELFRVVANSGALVSRADVRPAARTLGEYALVVDVSHQTAEAPVDILQRAGKGFVAVEMLETFPVIAEEVSAWML